ncbi:sensor histidine kinase [Actinosynnema sp. NPDC047251]|uniref:histidine kinase n=1 Tax=Saccharothrix espanaensis (strain ATCC 51144 / DSM 44229 / JCM 9112 / NBRC 15066 / NRRL 15764) TaxID=1179773 RepID=K0JQM2_SACES|nr:sensor histidine kinase [Saccharothrix espanaensis]CCH29705.1 Two-component system, sensor histidine kinase [Saccharothrix espanaensis DSM 44229]
MTPRPDDPPRPAGDLDWSQWRRPRPTPARQRHDWWLALAVAAGSVVMTALVSSMGVHPAGSGPALAEQYAWGVAVSAPLALRRRYPLIVPLVVGVVFLAGQARHVGDNLIPSIALFIALYSAGAWAENRTAARRVRIGVIVVMFGWLGFGLVRFTITPSPAFERAAGPLDPVLASVLYGIVFNLMFFLSAYFFGGMAWLSARRRAELAHWGEQLRLSQEQNTRGAIVAERVRIARDLHDVVAHHVSVMGVQAGAARRVLDRDPDLARSALQTVEETARTAIGELRGLLGVLRAEPDEEPEQEGGETSSPGLAQLPELAAMARSTGLDVDHGVFGDPRPVPAAVALSAYRIVQESLTNVVKHAGARRADVRVRFLETTLEVEVADDGRGRSGAPERGGFGLVGMRERVAVHGGRLEAGPRRGGGYRVRAWFPV